MGWVKIRYKIIAQSRPRSSSPNNKANIKLWQDYMNAPPGSLEKKLLEKQLVELFWPLITSALDMEKIKKIDIPEIEKISVALYKLKYSLNIYSTKYPNLRAFIKWQLQKYLISRLYAMSKAKLKQATFPEETLIPIKRNLSNFASLQHQEQVDLYWKTIFKILSPREKTVLFCMRKITDEQINPLGKQLTSRQLAKKLGVTFQMVANIEKKALKKVQTFIAENNLTLSDYL